MRFTAFFHSIAGKLFLLIVVCVLMAIAGIFTQSQRMFLAVLHRQISDGMVGQARESANFVNATVENWSSLIAIFMQNLDRMDPKEWPRSGEAFVSSNVEFLALMVVRSTGGRASTPIAAKAGALDDDPRYGSHRPLDVHRRTLAALQTLGESTRASTDWSRKLRPVLRTLPIDGLPIVVLALPFKSRNNTRYVAMLATWNTRIVGALPGGEHVRSYVIDAVSAVVATSAADVRGLSSSAIRRRLTNDALRGKVRSGFKKYEMGAETVLGAFSHIPLLNLSVIVEQDASEAEATIARIVTRVALWSWLFILISVFVSYFVASGITRNIRTVAAATTRIARGDLEQRLDIRSRDEVGKLGASVNFMTGELRRLLREMVEKTRMESELSTAQLVQEHFLPRAAVERGALRIHGIQKSASECGGDWWGHYSIGAGVELICIADVTGHGVPAALVTAAIYAYATSTANTFQDMDASTFSVSKYLAELNHLLWTAGKGSMTATVQAVLIDTRSHVVKVANGGHVMPLVLPALLNDKRITNPKRPYKSLFTRGDIVGIGSDFSTKVLEAAFLPGDRLLMFTDGLTDCQGPTGVRWGLGRMQEQITTLFRADAVALVTDMVADALLFNGAKPLSDDVTLILVEHRGIESQSAETKPVA